MKTKLALKIHVLYTIRHQTYYQQLLKMFDKSSAWVNSIFLTVSSNYK